MWGLRTQEKSNMNQGYVQKQISKEDVTRIPTTQKYTEGPTQALERDSTLPRMVLRSPGEAQNLTSHLQTGFSLYHSTSTDPLGSI